MRKHVKYLCELERVTLWFALLPVFKGWSEGATLSGDFQRHIFDLWADAKEGEIYLDEYSGLFVTFFEEGAAAEQRIRENSLDEEIHRWGKFIKGQKKQMVLKDHEKTQMLKQIVFNIYR